MKLTFSELLQIQQIFPIEDKLPFKTAYALAKLGEIIENEIKFYTQKMQEIIQEYAEKDDEGNPVRTQDGSAIKIIPEKMEECSQKMEELHSVEVDIGYVSFSEESLEALTLTTQQAYALMPLIKD